MPASPQARFLPGGDTALVVEFGDRVDQQPERPRARPGASARGCRHPRRGRGRADLPLAPGALRSVAAEAGGAETPPRAAAGWPRSRRERRPALAHSRLLRREHGPRSGRRRGTHGAQHARGRRAPQRHDLPRLHDGLPAGPALSRRPAAGIQSAAAREPAHQAAERLHRRRHGHDRHLPPGKPGRLAHPGAHAGAAVGHGAATRPRCWPPATRWCSSRYRSANTRRCWPGLRPATCVWCPSNQPESRAHDGGAAGCRSWPHDNAAGPGPAGLPAPGRAGLGRARSREPARRQPAGRQSAGHGSARDRLSGADARGRGRQRAHRRGRRPGADRHYLAGRRRGASPGRRTKVPVCCAARL